VTQVVLSGSATHASDQISRMKNDSTPRMKTDSIQRRRVTARTGSDAEKSVEEKIRRKTVAGKLNAGGLRFGIVVSRFNEFITDRLLRSAYDALVRSGVREKDIQIVRVPGSFEIPSAARTLAETKKYHAIVCLGCLIRGDTAHYDVIVNEVTRGIGQSAQETGVPHAFGVLTCENLEQAIDRAGLKMGNKGFEAALAAVEMANLKKAVVGRSSLVVRKIKSKNKSKPSSRRGRASKKKR
jgi:6,7-dimethyl-8-ribityllumazine synthase